MRSSLVPRFIKKTGVLEQPQVSQPIRELRELTGLTQTQLAALVGVAYGTINRWKNGRMQPSQLALKQIKAVLEEINHSSDVELQQRSQQLLDKYFLPSTDRGVDADESNFRQPL